MFRGYAVLACGEDGKVSRKENTIHGDVCHGCMFREALVECTVCEQRPATGTAGQAPQVQSNGQ